MAYVLGVNAVFHDPAAALVVDGVTVAAAEEERFSRRKHGKPPVAFSTWELPELDPARVRWVPHHVAHAASATFASGYDPCSVLVLDGRGECASQLAARSAGGELEILAAQRLPHSLGILYEELTAHLGFRRSSDEYKVMAMASYGEPSFLDAFRELLRPDGEGGFSVGPIDFGAFAPALAPGAEFTPAHAALAASVQRRLEEILLELAGWLHERTGDRDLVMAGGVALNCVANSVLWREGPFDRIWVQPAAGDSGTALGAALHVAHQLGDAVAPMPTAALGRGWDEDALEQFLRVAQIDYERPGDVADEVARVLAGNGVVAWFQGRSE